MRAFLRGVFCLLLGISGAALAQDALLKPFVLGSKGPGEVAQNVEAAKAKLTQNGFTIAGSYSPYPNATIIARDQRRDAHHRRQIRARRLRRRPARVRHQGRQRGAGRLHQPRLHGATPTAWRAT